MRRSIRVELPATYAAVALLTAVALGAVLLLALSDYYGRLERRYMASVARAFSSALAPLLEQDAADEAVEAQLSSLAFLSRTRVRLLDAEGALVADSRVPGRFRLALAAERGVSGGAVPEKGAARVVISVGPGEAGEVVTTTLPVRFALGLDGTPDLPWLEALPSLPLGERAFPLDAGTTDDALGPGVGLVVRQPVYSGRSELLGTIELSEGPSYRREIVSSVAWGWALAGGVAVLLAGTAGWLVSRRISRPLLSLTRATAAMAGGDLSARAEAARRDEFGTLGRSFNGMADRVQSTVLALRRFASDAAHELRTPLATLRTNLEMMDEAEPGAKEPLARARAQVQRLEALTDGLLDLSRLEAGAGGPPEEAISLTTLVQEMAESAASQAEQAGLTFALELPDAPVTVRGDPAQLRRALRNLVDNACKFTPEGGRVTLGLRQEGREAAAWVEDTGIGVPEEEIPQLFQRFHRGRNSATYPGSGLGLAIVRAIAERHGGRACAERTSGGSRFTLRLPLA